MRLGDVLALAALATAHARIIDFEKEDLLALQPTVVGGPIGLNRGGKIRIRATQDRTGDHPFYVYAMAKTKWDAFEQRSSLDGTARLASCRLPSEGLFQGMDSLEAEFTSQVATRFVVVATHCAPLRSSISGRLEFTNPGSPYPQLAADSPSVWRTSTWLWVCYAVLCAGTVLITLLRRDSLRVPLGMLSLSLFLRALEFYSLSRAFAHRALTGSDDDSVYAMYRAFGFTSTTVYLLFTTLISLGFGLTHSSCPGYTPSALSGATVVHITVGIFAASCNSDSILCNTLAMAEFVIRSIFMLSIIVALNFNITHLRAVVSSSAWVDGTHRLYACLAALHDMRKYFLLYLIWPTAVVVLRSSVLTWRGGWIAIATEQAGYILVLVLMLQAVHPRIGAQLRSMQGGAERSAVPETAYAARAASEEGEEPSRGRRAAIALGTRLGRVLAVTGDLDGVGGADQRESSPVGRRRSSSVAPLGPPAKVVASSLLSEAVSAGINVRSHVPGEEEEGEGEEGTSPAAQGAGDKEEGVEARAAQATQ